MDESYRNLSIAKSLPGLSGQRQWCVKAFSLISDCYINGHNHFRKAVSDTMENFNVILMIKDSLFSIWIKATDNCIIHPLFIRVLDFILILQGMCSRIWHYMDTLHCVAWNFHEIVFAQTCHKWPNFLDLFLQMWRKVKEKRVKSQTRHFNGQWHYTLWPLELPVKLTPKGFSNYIQTTPNIVLTFRTKDKVLSFWQQLWPLST